MFKFRPQRGSLADAMDEVEEFESKADLVKKLINDYKGFFPSRTISESTVEIKPYIYDDRINWDTYIVTIKGLGVLGFTDGPVIE